jgi:hypothetical protein
MFSTFHTKWNVQRMAMAACKVLISEYLIHALSPCDNCSPLYKQQVNS